MSYAIVWSSETGNTEQLARSIREVAGDDCLYMGAPSDAALAADRVYIGFWTDKGTCDGEVAAFLSKLGEQEVFLFGTAGFGGSREYFDQIMGRVLKNVPAGATVVGAFMCQGKMPMAVRERYEAMRRSGDSAEKVDAMIANFDEALSHPDDADKAALHEAVRATL